MTPGILGDLAREGLLCYLKTEHSTGRKPWRFNTLEFFSIRAILGISRNEIEAKFDEIISFAEIEKFLDTPVKRYSSGMYVTLASAVAAHLEPEILMIDEGLAVGDAEFQKKCLGKMSGVTGEGRTLLFVSHNLSAVSALFERSLLIKDGRLQIDGATDHVIAEYLTRNEWVSKTTLCERNDRVGNGRLRFSEVSITNANINSGYPICGKKATVTLAYESDSSEKLSKVRIAILFRDLQGRRLFARDTHLLNAEFKSLPSCGRVFCRIPRLPLAVGRYQMSVWATVAGSVADSVENAGDFSVLEENDFGTGRFARANKHGPCVVEHDWSFADRDTC